MAEKENNQRHKSTIDKYFSRTADGYKVWAEEDKEEEAFYRLQLRRLEIQTKTDAKDSISILLTPVRPISSQAESLKQC
jgi:hypothetical protein